MNVTYEMSDREIERVSNIVSEKLKGVFADYLRESDKVAEKDEFLTKGMVAEMLKVSVKTVDEYATRGIISKPYKIGSRPRWRKSELLFSIKASSDV